MIALVVLVVGGAVAALEPGSYALVVVVEGPRTVPLLGSMETRTESWSFVELRANPNGDGSQVATETACSIESDGGLFVARASPGLLAGLQPSSWVLRESATGDVTADRGEYALGYQAPAGQEEAPLPNQSDDPRVTDPDKDGLPGAAMTVEVRGIGALRLQVVSAWRTTLFGRLRGNTAEGFVRATTREEILSGLPMPGRLEPVHLRSDRSRFRLAPLPRGSTGCAAVELLRSD